MSDAVGGLLTIGILVIALGLSHTPLGGYLAGVFTSEKHWRAERLVYRAVGVAPDSSQTWSRYAASVLAFSLACVVALFALILTQAHLPLAAKGQGMHADTALNTAVSFVTNTNWQSYAGETGVTRLTQTLGLSVQNFASAAVGLAVAVALVRGLTGSGTDRLGNFWVDLTRGVTRVLLPGAVLAALVLVCAGVIQNLDAAHTITTLTGGHQVIQGGLIASQESIKELGTNGGGYLNANSAHPFENPNPFTNIFEIYLMLVIPFALPRTYGILVGDRRQGHAILAFMVTLWGAALAAAMWAEVAASHVATGAMEGKEQRFGVWSSVLFASSTTSTSTGAVNSLHESYSPLGGGVLLVNMMLGEVSPGGVGSGLYGALIIAVLAVFVAGLMVGRTPEILGKHIGRREITLASLATLTMPALVLLGTSLAVSMSSTKAAILGQGPRGLTEALYAYTSAANNNGSAYAGLSADAPFYNLSLAVAMAVGRFVPIVLVLALAGSLGAQRRRPDTDGTMPTHTPLFVVLLLGIALIVAGLTFFPSLALGPIAEAVR